MTLLTHRSPSSALLGLAVLAALSGAADGSMLSAQNPLARNRQNQDHPFAGRFAGDGLRLELRWDAQTAGYAGTLTSDGQAFPCTATEKGGSLRGSFRSGGEDYAFSASLDGDRLALVSDGETMNLRREGAAPRPGVPNDQPAGTRGGAGIALRVNDDHEFVIAQVAPAGPAARAGLKPGGILRAVDSKDVEGMTLEQVGALISGPVGKIVVLTVETADEVLDVMIERAVLGAPPKTGADTPVEGGNGAGHGGMVAGDDRGLRPVANADASGMLKPGTRITWYLGSATLNGVRSQLVQDDKGNWVDPQTGQRFSDQENPNAAGAGYLQFDISTIDGEGLAGDARNYLMMDPAQGRLLSSTSQAMVGDAQALGDYWVNPRKLAAMQETESPGYRVRRLRYPLEGREFDAIAIETRSAQGFFRNTYDLASGLLIAGSSSTTGANVPTVDPNGKVTGGAGATTITSSRLVSVRDRRLPWGDIGTAGCRAGQHFDYSGTQSTVIPGVPEMPMQFSWQAQVQSAQRGFVLCRTHSRLTSGYSAPQESEALRVFGNGSLCGLVVPPQALRQLRPEQVLDEDPVTHFRTVFAGMQGDQAMIVEQGPSEQTQYVYDLRSGVLTNYVFQQNGGVGTTVFRLQLQGQR